MNVAGRLERPDNCEPTTPLLQNLGLKVVAGKSDIIRFAGIALFD